MDKLVSISQAADMLGVSTKILRIWDGEGKVEAVRTAGGHRRYRLSEVEKLQGIQPVEQGEKKEVIAIYARVSSHEQKEKGDLARQKSRLVDYCLEKKYHVSHSLEDVGSGMSSSRTRLKRLFDLVEAHEITKVIVEHKDRLTRFNFGVYERYFNSHGVTIEYAEDKANKTYEQELVDDMISLMSSFSSKIYGKRSAENRRKRKLEKLAAQNGSVIIEKQKVEIEEIK